MTTSLSAMRLNPHQTHGWPWFCRSLSFVTLPHVQPVQVIVSGSMIAMSLFKEVNLTLMDALAPPTVSVTKSTHVAWKRSANYSFAVWLIDIRLDSRVQVSTFDSLLRVSRCYIYQDIQPMKCRYMHHRLGPSISEHINVLKLIHCRLGHLSFQVL